MRARKECAEEGRKNDIEEEEKKKENVERGGKVRASLTVSEFFLCIREIEGGGGRGRGEREREIMGRDFLDVQLNR